MESARRSAEGLKITIDADLLPRYLVPRDSRFVKIPRIYPRFDNAVALIFLYAYSDAKRCILFIRDVFRQVTKCAASTNFPGNITRKHTLQDRIN